MIEWRVFGITKAMWFKNTRLFRLNEDFAFNAEQLNEMLKKEALRACPPMDMISKGWISPFGNDVLVWQSGSALLFGLGVEEKVLPAAVVNHQLNQRIDSIKRDTGNKPSRKQQTDMKQQLVVEMLPQAFVKPRQIYACLDLQQNMLLVDSASQNAAEDLVSQLRHTLGSFKASAFGPSSSVAQVMTQWVQQDRADAGFELSNEIVLETLDDNKGVVRGRNIESLDEQMQKHIDNGYLVTQLGLVFNERVELLLGHDLGIKKLKFTDIVLDQLDQAEDEFQALDAKFTLFSLEMRAMLQALFSIF